MTTVGMNNMMMNGGVGMNNKMQMTTVGNMNNNNMMMNNMNMNNMNMNMNNMNMNNMNMNMNNNMMMNKMGMNNMNMMNNMGMNNMNMMNNMGMNNMNMMNMRMMNPGMNNMNMMNMGMMNPGMNNMNMMNMNMMMPNGMVNSGNFGMNLSQKIEDNEGWTITYEKDGTETQLKISPDKTILEAGNVYKLKANLKGDLKYKYGTKYLDGSLQLCQSGLVDGAKITVEVVSEQIKIIDFIFKYNLYLFNLSKK